MAVEYLTIELVHGKWWLCQNGHYNEDSVLAGQEFRQLSRCYQQDLEKAKAKNPGVPVVDDHYVPPAYIPVEPPDWFDPADAGEVWSEDDY